ncbi:unnamed protein product [Moneuplotes crassus]|uniref:3-beta hydroxysteroid dehydrogenase/isomerase domain-containing protein n=1 Tax=Euplotes crassus TaxID=5936 RepID=A0AAD1XID2_EUPCR|nr:unnamed protein product [Moneuplotes crassus]
MDSSKPLVTVIGASEYVGAWLVAKLLQTGQYRVRGTLKNPRKLEYLRGRLKDLCESEYENLELVLADLLDYTSLEKAVDGASVVFMMAYGAVKVKMKDFEGTALKVMVEGTADLLNACDGAGVQKVIIKSDSTALIDFRKGSGTYGHDDISEEHSKCTRFQIARIRQEKVVKSFVEELDQRKERKFDVVLMNPENESISGAPLVPEIKENFLGILNLILGGKMPYLPALYHNIIDVQDVAQAHINAIEKGKHMEKYPLCCETIKAKEMVKNIIIPNFRPPIYQIGDKEMSKCLIWIVSFCIPEGKALMLGWNKKFELDGEYSTKELGLKECISAYDSVLETCNYLVQNNLLGKAPGQILV